MASRRSGDEAGREAEARLGAAIATLRNHPLFGPLAIQLGIHRDRRCPEDGWAVAAQSGSIWLHPKRRAETDEWLWVLAHCTLHFAFGHFQVRDNPRAWNAACDLIVARFVKGLGSGVCRRRPNCLSSRRRATKNDCTSCSGAMAFRRRSRGFPRRPGTPT